MSETGYQPRLPGRLLLDVALLVAGAYGLRIVHGYDGCSRDTMLLLMCAWYAACGLDLAMTVVGAPPTGWPRKLAGGIAGWCLLATLGLVFVRPLPSWWAFVLALACAAPALWYATTGRYPGHRPPPPD
jgi:hypothetical protein